MRNLLYFVLFLSFGANAQDTTIVQTFKWDNPTRRAVFEFPNDPNQEYRKVLMHYNMRCHNAAVGVGSVGCYEWDYSCNTFLTDSSRIDSTLATHSNYLISGFTGSSFEYQFYPTNSIYETTQKITTHQNVQSEKISKINAQTIPSVYNSRNASMRMQLLISAQELVAAGAPAGKINGITLRSESGGNFKNLKVKIKETSKTALSNNPDITGFTEHFYNDVNFSAKETKTLYFHTTYNWNGSSALLLDLSFTNETNDPIPDLSMSSETNAHCIISDQSDPCMIWDGVSAEITSTKLQNIDKEITISFWLFGTPQKQPVNSSAVEVVNDKNQRDLNLHIPWSNGSFYFDCGNENGSYDRIEKAATVQEYEANWNYWTFTKNATTGNLRIYKNGSLWLQGTGKTKAMHFTKMKIGEAITYDGVYFGRMKHFALWNKELDSTQIKEGMHIDLTSGHSASANLLFYYKFDQGNSDNIKDYAANPTDVKLPFALRTYQDKGERHLYNFNVTNSRPLIGIVQGNYTGTNTTLNTVRDSVPQGPKKIRQYSVSNFNLVLDSTFYLYEGGLNVVYNENGDRIEDIISESDGLFTIDNLKYYRKIPSKYELLSLVTPYGNNLDLGKNGKTFVFDVTDFTPILKGKKLLSMEMGGENQEEIDLKFYFIKGTPERKVIDVQNIWPFERGYFAEILNNSKFEPRNMAFSSNVKYANLRLSITGHEQNGEFTNRRHYVQVNGKSIVRSNFNVWKECAFNPIYPQGGTWIFDRAGWCPGAPTDLHRFDISSNIDYTKANTFDYGVDPPQLDQANYLVSSQLVTYGDYNYKTDVALEEIMRPNADRVEFERLNPTCNIPKILIRNSGSDELKSVEIIYGRRGGLKEIYQWTGSLLPSKNVEIDLPINNSNFWSAQSDTNRIFEVELNLPNGTADQNVSNNKLSTNFKLADQFPQNFFFEFKTNSKPADNNYKITNAKGDIVIERNNMVATTTYRDEFALPPGCYTLHVADQSHDGLYFWFYPNFGAGTSKIVRKLSSTLYLPIKTFGADFGGGFQYDFVITEPVSTNDPLPFELFSISPNPCIEELRLDLQSDKFKSLEYKILTATGSEIERNKLNLNLGVNTFNLDVHHLVSGIYLLKLQQGNLTKTVKFVKQ